MNKIMIALSAVNLVNHWLLRKVKENNISKSDDRDYYISLIYGHYRKMRGKCDYELKSYIEINFRKKMLWLIYEHDSYTISTLTNRLIKIIREENKYLNNLIGEKKWSYVSTE